MGEPDDVSVADFGIGYKHALNWLADGDILTLAPPPALDWTNFVRSVGEDEPLARELLEQFTLELPGHLARMRAAGDHEALQRALHSIRNAAENYHAIRLHAAIVAAERSLAAGRDTESGLVDVEVEASVVLAAVSMVAPRRTAGLTRAPLP
jgi:HPt (histidine-containing phosphotransfer) domain-containing protein